MPDKYMKNLQGLLRPLVVFPKREAEVNSTVYLTGP